MKKNLLLLIVVLLFFSCDGVLNPPVAPPEQDTEEKEIPIEEILFDWDDESGSYVFKTNHIKYLGLSGHSIWKLSQNFENIMTSFEADIYKVSGEQSGGFGLVFGAQDTENFFAVEIDSNKGFYIFKVVEGERFHISDGWEVSDSLKVGYGVKNRVKIENMGGNIFSIFFNGIEVFNFEDTEEPFFTGGRYGFIADVTSLEEFPEVPVEYRFEPISEINM